MSFCSVFIVDFEQINVFWDSNKCVHCVRDITRVVLRSTYTNKIIGEKQQYFLERETKEA